MSARVRIRPAGDGYYLGTLAIGCDLGSGGVGDTDGDAIITVGAFGESQADALHKAALVAERIVDDPVMKALLPPQAKAAIVATKKLATAAKKGRKALSRMFGKLRGPGKKRLARALAKEQRTRPRPPPRMPPPAAATDDDAEAYDDEGEDMTEAPAQDTAPAQDAAPGGVDVEPAAPDDADEMDEESVEVETDDEGASDGD